MEPINWVEWEQETEHTPKDPLGRAVKPSKEMV